jgi:hypothetical protein
MAVVAAAVFVAIIVLTALGYVVTPEHRERAFAGAEVP